MISESSLTSEHYFLSMTQRLGEKTVYGQTLTEASYMRLSHYADTM